MQKNIMVIDDSRSWRLLAKHALNEAGYDVTEACDGLAALGELKEKRFDLIICDLHMPNLNGIAFIKKLKTLPDHRFTPVLILTTDNNDAKRQEGYAAGAQAWMTKPFPIEDLMVTVAQLFAV
ncbi:MAG: response regulator [Gammaproteobacteria bacterium]|nr:response regulator [Gammaproteobacteria bacterium]